MKKVLGLLVAVMVLTGVAQAQEKQFKPESGDFTTELQFAPFAAQPFSEMGLSGRYFFNNRWSLRVNLDFGFNGNRNVTEAPDVTLKTSSSMFRIAPGFEYHMGNWNRVSVYTGAELFFRTSGSKTTRETNDGTSEWKNITQGGDRNGHNTIGFNALLGTDVYIVKGLYMGAEFRLGFDVDAVKKGKIKTPDRPTETLDSKSTSWNFGFNCEPRIRLGWRF